MKLSIQQVQLLICLSGFLDLFGVAMLYPLLIHHAKEMGASPSQVGYFGSIYGCLQFFSSPIMGQVSDHVGRRTILMLSLVGTFFGYFAMGVAQDIVMLSIARIPSGLFKHSQSLSRTYLADITPKSQRSTIFGLFNSVSSLGFIIGPTIGGYISVTENGFTKVAILSSSIFLCNFLFIYLIIPVQNTIAQNDQITIAQNDNKVLKDENKRQKEFNLLQCLNGFRNIHLIPWHLVWDVFLIRFLLSFSIILFRANFTSVLMYRFNTDPITNGYIMSFNGILSAITAFSVRWIIPCFSTNSSLHNTFAVVMVTSLLCITLASSLNLVVLFLIPLCISSAVLRVTNATAMFNKSNAEVMGLLNGLGDTLTSVARALGPLIAGVAQEMSIYGPGVCGTGLAVIGTIVGFYSSNEIIKKEHRE